MEITFYYLDANIARMTGAHLAQPDNPAAVDLYYWHAYGKVSLNCPGGARLGLEVPIIGFAANLFRAVASLATVHSATVELPESDANLLLSEKGEKVEISTDFAEWRCAAGLNELTLAASAFLSAALGELRQLAPWIVDHPDYNEAARLLAGT